MHPENLFFVLKNRQLKNTVLMYIKKQMTLFHYVLDEHFELGRTNLN